MAPSGPHFTTAAPSAMSEDSAKKAKQGAGKRLNDKQRVEIIQLAENSKISKRQLADKYGVSEAAIRKLLLKKDEFLKRYYDTPEEIRDQRLRGKNVRAGSGVHDGDAAQAATVGAPGGASFARGVTTFPASSKSLYPSDEPWKHGLHSLTGKVTPFLKGFLQSKHAQAADQQPAAIPIEPTDALVADVDSEVPTAASLLDDALTVDWIGFSRMLRDIRRAFHRYPETGYQEVRTQAFLKRFCESSLRIPGKNIRVMASTGLVVDVCYENATIAANDKRKLPVLAFRADMDALPIEELNDHLPYCSTQKKQRKDVRRRKKRKTTVSAAANTPIKTDEEAAQNAEGSTTASEDLSTAVDASVNQTAEVGTEVMIEMPSSAPGTPVTLSANIPVQVALDGDDAEDSDSSGQATAAAHMCGHDGHMVMVLGLCALVVRNAHLLPKDTFVRFIFQPAEEGPGGAQKMIQEGALEEVDEIYGLHNHPFPLYSVHVRPGPVMAHEVEFSIDILGVGGHGSAPQNCIDPILTGSAVVQSLQSVVSRGISPMDTAVLSVTQFRGGDANNVIPSSAYLAGTIRVFDMEVAEKIKRRVETVVSSTCAAHGATGNVHFLDGYAPVINPYEETRNVQQIAMETGLFVSEQGMPLMASEDFSYYLQERKGCYFFLGTKEDGDDAKTRALHSNHFDFNDKAIPLGIRMFLGILQSRFGCELYSIEELQAFQVAMERIAISVSIV